VYNRPLAAFQITALGYDFAELVYMDIKFPAFKKIFQLFTNKFAFDDTY
jgi:hypothetical protein